MEFGIWRKSSRSSAGDCVEVACVHDAQWRKSAHSTGDGECVEIAPIRHLIAVRDSKLDTTGDFPYLTVDTAEWSGLMTAIRDDGA
ncbi:DUF397 domain-containing protein [Stackebrandtia soli]|uniref:DUF397 domain-containing protein n=1 Tax=Stackebrandtia soli TaxID=1892856 RepID=UPI0039E88A9B